MAELNADDLDKVSKDVPIFIVNQSGHIGYVNRKAFELAGVTDKTPNPNSQPPFGIFLRCALILAIKVSLVSYGKVKLLRLSPRPSKTEVIMI